MVILELQIVERLDMVSISYHRLSMGWETIVVCLQSRGRLLDSMVVEIVAVWKQAIAGTFVRECNGIQRSPLKRSGVWME